MSRERSRAKLGGLEPLYRELTGLFELSRLESDELAHKASRLGALLEQYAVE